MPNVISGLDVKKKRLGECMSRRVCAYTKVELKGECVCVCGAQSLSVWYSDVWSTELMCVKFRTCVCVLYRACVRICVV